MFSSTPGAGKTPVTDGFPAVRVPVLSKTAVSASASVCKAAAEVNSTPAEAALPVATTTAIGVASPSAQGQATTNTEMTIFKTVSNGCPASVQATAATAAMPSTDGTKIAAARSASAAMGGLVVWACSTSRMICPKTVSAPMRAAR